MAPNTQGTESADATLVERLRRGDDAAFEELVRNYGGRMLAVARRLLGNEADANDAVQEAFLSAFKSIDQFAGGAKLSTWLHRIAVNASLMRLRTRQRKREQSIDALLPTFKEDGHHVNPAREWRASAEQLAEKEETRQFVRDSIDKLPDAYRTVLVLRDLESLDTEETGRLLGISGNAVKTRLHRARQALRTLLESRLAGETE